MNLLKDACSGLRARRVSAVRSNSICSICCRLLWIFVHCCEFVVDTFRFVVDPQQIHSTTNRNNYVSYRDWRRPLWIHNKSTPQLIETTTSVIGTGVGLYPHMLIAVTASAGQFVTRASRLPGQLLHMANDFQCIIDFSLFTIGD